MTDLLYFDCFAGISGDMVLGALLDLGIDRNELFSQLDSLALPGYHLEVQEKQVKGIRSTDFEVVVNAPQEHHRHLSDIKKIIRQSNISEGAKELADRIFHALGEAEAHVHGIALEKVHFHEVGAIDSIIDIVGAAICIDMIKPGRIVASPLHVGYGTVRCAHGLLPVPAPATAELVRNVPIYGGEVQGELVTPTGAAIITTLTNEFGALPKMAIGRIGYGAGKKDFGIPNLLRVFMGKDQVDQKEEKKELLLLETNIDDMNPEIYSSLIPQLIGQGANDAYLSNIIMKKGRPGVMLNVLCHQGESEKFEEIIFRETSTLGIRKIAVTRSCLERKIETIATPFGPAKVKIAFKEGRVLKVAPEYEECARIAREKDLPLRDVYEAILGCDGLKALRP